MVCYHLCKYQKRWCKGYVQPQSWYFMNDPRICIKAVNYTSGFRLVEEDTRHLICGVQDVLRVVGAQTTSLRDFVVSCKGATTRLLSFVTYVHAPNAWNILQRCMACFNNFVLSKPCLYKSHVCITQRNGQKQNYQSPNEIHIFQNESHVSVCVETCKLSFFLLGVNCANDKISIICFSNIRKQTISPSGGSSIWLKRGRGQRRRVGGRKITKGVTVKVLVILACLSHISFKRML